MTRSYRSLVVVTALAVAWPPAPSAHAWPVAATQPAAVDGPDVLAGPTGLGPDALVAGEDAAYQAYMRGTRAFEANDFDRALVDFGDALRLLPDAPPYARSRGSIALWIARCHGQRYGLRGDAAELDRESAVLDAYAARLDSIAAGADDRAAKQALVDTRKQEIERERQRISGTHGDVDTQLDRSVSGGYEGVTASSWAPRVEDLAWYRRRDDPRPRGRQQHETEEKKQLAPEAGRRPGTGLLAAGGVSLGVGVAALAVMAAGMARAHAAESFAPAQSPAARREQIGRGMAGNTMAIAGAVTGGVGVIAGAVLVGLGVKRRRAEAGRVAVHPALGRRAAALSLTVRF